MVADPRRNLGIWLLAFALIVLVAGGGWWLVHDRAAKRQAADQPPQAIPVQVAQVEKKDLPVYLVGLGTVQAYNTVVVRTRVDGELQQVNFTEGQTVHQGDILAQIDPRPYKAALAQAVAKKAQDSAQLRNSKLDLARSNDLIARGATSQQQRDTQQATVDQYTAQADADQAAIDSAQTQLDYATIRAPLTGRTGLRLVDRGSIVHASDANGIVEIVQLQPIAALFSVPEDQVQNILKAEQSGETKVSALTPDGKTTIADGKLLLVNNSVDVQSGTIRLKAEFPNTDDALWPGQSISGRVLVRTLHDAAAIPPAAVQQGPQGAFTYVLKADDIVEKRDLKLGMNAEGWTVVDAGVKPGETVVVSGQYRLKPDSRVTINAPEAKKQVAQEGSTQ